MTAILSLLLGVVPESSLLSCLNRLNIDGYSATQNLNTIVSKYSSWYLSLLARSLPSTDETIFTVHKVILFMNDWWSEGLF